MQTYESPSPSYGDYDSDRELERLYSAITGRPAFSYTPGADPLYRSYADRYVQNGRLAMRDTMGQSAALTGGYGSSYAQSAGQQRYDEYLRSLGEVLPELYGQAWQRYQAEGEALGEAYDRAWQRRENAYQRSRDALADQRYEAEQAGAAAQQAYKQQQDSYARLYKLIASTGYQPTDAELQAAGLSRAQAEALRYEYLRAHKLLPQPAAASGGGGWYRSAKKTKSGKKSASSAKASGAAVTKPGASGGGSGAGRNLEVMK